MERLYWQASPVMTGEVLVTFKGKPLITRDMLDEEVEHILKMDKIYAETYTWGDLNWWYRDMLNTMIIRRIIYEYMVENNIPEYPKLFYWDLFDEIKNLDVADIRLKRKQQRALWDEKIKELEKKYEVVVNEDYFKQDYFDVQDNK